MPTNRKPLHRAHRGRLSHVADCVLRYGRDDRWADAFESEEEHRAAWERARDNFYLNTSASRPPMAGGDLTDRESPPAGYDHERSTLYEAGLLDEEECAWLLADWRREFARAQSADFFFCGGPQSFFHTRRLGENTIAGPISPTLWSGSGQPNTTPSQDNP